MNIDLPELAFIFPAHVSETKHKELWKESVRCIRNNYPITPIIIIVDNCSISSLGINDNDIIIDDNIKFIQSEFNGTGEILPYYYLYKYKLAKKAIIIQDSMFIIKPFNNDEINKIETIKFLWHFDRCKEYSKDLQFKLISKLNYNKELFNKYNDFDSWNGCFGVCSIITLNFIEKIQDKYNLFNILSISNSKEARCCIERLIAVISFYELNWNINDTAKYSLLDNMYNYFSDQGYNYDSYKTLKLDLPIIKCYYNR